jgi:hypothetical protein
MTASNELFSHGEKTSALAAGRVLSKSAVGGRRQAYADVTFSLIPVVGETLVINGTTYTLIANGGSPTTYQIALGTNLTTTIDAIVTKLNASAVAAVAKATYSNVAGTKLHIVHDAYGTAGNAFTIAETSTVATLASATLLYGLDADTIRLQHNTYGLETVIGGLTDYDLPAGDEGQEITLYLKTKGTSSNAQVNGTFGGGTLLTFDTAGKFAKLKYMNATWQPIANTGTIA